MTEIDLRRPQLVAAGHIPTIAPQHDDRLGVHCEACSRVANAYVWPCREGVDYDVPAVLVAASELVTMTAVAQSNKRHVEYMAQELEQVRADRDQMHKKLSHPVVRAVVDLAEAHAHELRRAEAAHELKDEANRRWLAAVHPAVAPQTDEPKPRRQWRTGGYLELGSIIAALEAEDPNRVLPIGFHEPHSYRGYYSDVAFVPAYNISIADMLTAARSALGATFEGWKGGDYTMGEHTDCWISTPGDTSDNKIGPMLLDAILSQPAATPVVSVPTTAADTSGEPTCELSPDSVRLIDRMWAAATTVTCPACKRGPGAKCDGSGAGYHGGRLQVALVAIDEAEAYGDLCGAAYPEVPSVTCTFKPGHDPIPRTFLDTRIGTRAMDHGNEHHRMWWQTSGTAWINGESNAGASVSPAPTGQEQQQ